MVTDGSRDEFEALRRRAYGPHPDIHLDPRAVDRLRELENESRREPTPIPRRDHETVVVETRPTAAVAESVEDPDTGEERTGIDWSWARQLFTRLLAVRRSTALIILSAAVVVIVSITALTLVQRVQTDPLRVGAVQVARLSIDDSYEVPQVFAYSEDEGSREAFQEFYGLRTIVFSGAQGWVPSGGAGDCLIVFTSADMKPDSNSFSGLMMSGCAAGGFPATIQFGTGAERVPEGLGAAFPDSAAFQFVLDADNREIVVFMTR